MDRNAIDMCKRVWRLWLLLHLILWQGLSKMLIKIRFFSSSRTKDNSPFSILITELVLLVIFKICLKKEIACGNPKISRIYFLNYSWPCPSRAFFCYPPVDKGLINWSKRLTAQQRPFSIRLLEFRVSFRVSFHFERTPELLYGTVSFFFPPTLPPWVILRDVIEW